MGTQTTRVRCPECKTVSTAPPGQVVPCIGRGCRAKLRTPAGDASRAWTAPGDPAPQAASEPSPAEAKTASGKKRERAGEGRGWFVPVFVGGVALLLVAGLTEDWWMPAAQAAGAAVWERVSTAVGYLMLFGLVAAVLGWMSRRGQYTVRQCKHINKDGARCPNDATHGDYCAAHKYDSGVDSWTYYN